MAWRLVAGRYSRTVARAGASSRPTQPHGEIAERALTNPGITTKHVLTLSSLTKEVSRPTIRATALVFEDRPRAPWRSASSASRQAQRTMLIVGETGTGKGWWPASSPTRARRRAAFIAVNCGTFVEIAHRVRAVRP